MGSPHAASETWQQARALVLEGIDDRMAVLRRLEIRKRLTEFVVLVSLWVAGSAVAITTIRLMPPGRLHWALLAVGVFLSAIAINMLVLLLHEGMHGTLFSSPFWNRWASVLLGTSFLMSFSAYQVMHLRHHTYLGDPRDPDDYVNYTTRPRLLWLMHFLRLIFGAFLYLFLIPTLAIKNGGPDQRRRIVVEYIIMLVIVGFAIAFVPGDLLLWAWGLPVVLVGYMTNLRGFAQHGIALASDPFTASRTMQPHPLVAFCLLNENYHLEHHLFPEVPSYHLRHLHELIWPRLPRAVVGRSYWGFLLRFLRATLTLDRTPIGLVVREQAVGSTGHDDHHSPFQSPRPAL